MSDQPKTTSYTRGRRGYTPRDRNSGGNKDYPVQVNVVGIISKYDPATIKNKTFTADGENASWVEILLPYSVPEWGEAGMATYNEKGTPTKKIVVQMPTPPDGKGANRRNIWELFNGKGSGEGLPKGSFVVFEKVTLDPETGKAKALYSHGGPTLEARRQNTGTVMPDVYFCVQKERTRKLDDGEIVFQGSQDLLVADPFGTTVVTKDGENFVEFKDGERRVFDMKAAAESIDARNGNIDAANTEGLRKWTENKAAFEAQRAEEDDEELGDEEFPPFQPIPGIEKNRGNLLVEAMSIARSQVPGQEKLEKVVSMNLKDALAYVVAKTPYGVPGFQLHARSVVRIPEGASEKEVAESAAEEVKLAKDPNNRVAVQFSAWDRPSKDKEGNTVKDAKGHSVYEPMDAEMIEEAFWNGKSAEVMKDIWENESNDFDFELVPMACMRQGAMSLVPSNYTGKGNPDDVSARCRIYDVKADQDRSKMYDWKSPPPKQKNPRTQKEETVKSIKKLLEAGAIVETPTMVLENGSKIAPVMIGWMRGHVEIRRDPSKPPSKFFGVYQQPKSIREPALPLADIPTPFMPKAHLEAVELVAKELNANKASYFSRQRALKSSPVAQQPAQPPAQEPEAEDAGYEGSENTP